MTNFDLNELNRFESKEEDVAAEKDIAAPSSSAEKSNNNFLALSILGAAILISGSVIYAVGVLNSNKQGAANVPAAGQNVPGSAGAGLQLTSRDVILGNPNAPVTLIEYGDYQCPFCGKFFTESEPQIRSNYIKTNKVKMVFRNFAFLGPESTAAAEAAECAKDQGKFWIYHDALYSAEVADGRENNGNLTRDLFIKLAKDNGLDQNSFTSCIDSKKYASVISQDTVAAQTLGVNSTPTTFINAAEVQGAVPYFQFAAAIDKALGSK